MTANINSFLVPPVLMEPDRIASAHGWLGHIPFAFYLIHTCQPNTFVELGTHTGNSYFAFCQAVKRLNTKTKCFAVDTWQGDKHAGLYDDDVFLDVAQYNNANYDDFSTLIRSTFDDARDKFDDGSIDILHIDGLHTYEAVKHDFESWLPKLSERAVVLFHDICEKTNGFGVWKFWQELEGQYPSLWFKQSSGLGVLAVGIYAPAALIDFMSLEKSQKEYIISIYEKIGTNISLREQTKMHQIEINQLKSQLADMTASTSWRITRPLRFIKRKALNLLLFKKIFFNAKTFRENLFGTINKISKIFKNEGVLGLQMRLRYAPSLYSHKLEQAILYQKWISTFDTIEEANRVRFRQIIEDFQHKPLISIVMPVYDPPVSLLNEAILSVRRQLYPHWELCIADDASTDPMVRQILEQHKNEDSRIKVIYRKTNDHISEASNSALQIATGEFVALLDHDDLLSEHALFWVTKEINTYPDVQILYSDEDKIDDKGRRYDPYFKCDWSMDLFLSQNMISHLGVYRKSLINDVGGFRKGLEGSQDYDLALRCVECIDPNQIRHIPKILYHWRSMRGSTALSIDQKPYAAVAGLKAINDYLNRNQISGKVKLVEFGYRVQYQIPKSNPQVSLIILASKNKDSLQRCVESIINKTRYPNYEIILVNGSSIDQLQSYPRIIRNNKRISIIQAGECLNYAALNNAAVGRAGGEIVGLLNENTQVINPDWMDEMVSHACRPGIAAVGARLLYSDDTIKHAGFILGPGVIAANAHEKLPIFSPGFFGRAALIQSFSAVSSDCLFIEKAIYEEIGGMDDDDLAIVYNDVDFCLRLLEKGYRNIWTPYAQLYYFESRAKDETHVNKKYQSAYERMQSRWKASINNDPAYSPNLTLDLKNFSYAFPPRTVHVL